MNMYKNVGLLQKWAFQSYTNSPQKIHVLVTEMSSLASPGSEDADVQATTCPKHYQQSPEKRAVRPPLSSHNSDNNTTPPQSTRAPQGGTGKDASSNSDPPRGKSCTQSSSLKRKREDEQEQENRVQLNSKPKLMNRATRPPETAFEDGVPGRTIYTAKTTARSTSLFSPPTLSQTTSQSKSSQTSGKLSLEWKMELNVETRRLKREIGWRKSMEEHFSTLPTLEALAMMTEEEYEEQPHLDFRFAILARSLREDRKDDSRDTSSGPSCPSDKDAEQEGSESIIEATEAEMLSLFVDFDPVF